MLNTGVDLIEIHRIAEAVEKQGARFLKRIYTSKELALCGDNVVRRGKNARKRTHPVWVIAQSSKRLNDRHDGFLSAAGLRFFLRCLLGRRFLGGGRLIRSSRLFITR